MNLFTERNRKKQKEIKLPVIKGESEVERGINQEVRINTNTTIYEIENQQGPTVQNRRLCSIFCNNL